MGAKVLSSMCRNIGRAADPCLSMRPVQFSPRRSFFFHLLPPRLRFNRGGPNLASCLGPPGAIILSIKHRDLGGPLRAIYPKMWKTAINYRHIYHNVVTAADMAVDSRIFKGFVHMRLPLRLAGCRGG